MSMKLMYLGLAATALLTAGTAANAAPAVMVQAKGCSIIAGGPGFGTCTETYNQAGLSPGYIDEVTSLHPYLASNPQHTATFAGFEWFSNSGTTSASASYYTNPSTVAYIDHFVLWNEESSGIGSFNLWYGATAGALTDLVLSNISPFDNPLASYGPQYWEFAKRPKTGWWTLEMSGCPQANPGSFPACAIGEVAFGGNVPEPSSWAMMIVGFGLVGATLRRRNAAVVSA
jgi:hypothetical protein